jgi:hypothetical protein
MAEHPTDGIAVLKAMYREWPFFKTRNAPCECVRRSRLVARRPRRARHNATQSSVLLQELDLDVVQRIQVRGPVAYRAIEQRIILQKLAMTRHREQGLDRVAPNMRCNSATSVASGRAIVPTIWALAHHRDAIG